MEMLGLSRGGMGREPGGNRGNKLGEVYSK